MRAFKPEFGISLVLNLAVISTVLCGCSHSSQTPSPQKEAASFEQEGIPQTFNLKGGVLEVQMKSPCSFNYKRAGAPDFERLVGSAESGNVIYSRPESSTSKNGPDAIIEWTYRDDYHFYLVFCADSKGKITNVIETGREYLRFEKDKSNSVQNAEFNCIFSEFGGAHQVIVPIKLVWLGDKFVLAPPLKRRTLSKDEFDAKVQECKPLLQNGSGGALTAELAEDVLQLISEGDEKDARKLLHSCFHGDRKNEEKRWTELRTALNERYQNIVTTKWISAREE